ncbi:MAG TPA: hypothetical protein PKW15_01580 [Alphaproteobacteria bacterium]|nr:hypothetical protein [Alphaproteobacteria bacterium]
MSELAAIQLELQEITAELMDAAEKIDAGVSLDLSPLGPRAQDLCHRILTLPPEEAMAMLAEMNIAVDILSDLSEKLKSSP